jgi:hypothetical protein
MHFREFRLFSNHLVGLTGPINAFRRISSRFGKKQLFPHRFRLKFVRTRAFIHAIRLPAVGTG